MKRLILFILVITQISYLQAQTKKRISLQINYRLNGNLFVRSYDEVGGPAAMRFLNNEFIGSIAGLEMAYSLNKKSRLGLAFAKSLNSIEIDYSGNVIPVTIINFHITHINNFFQLVYD